MCTIYRKLNIPILHVCAMAIDLLKDIDGSGLLEPDDLEAVAEALTTINRGPFVLEGSLLDYEIDEYPKLLDFSITEGGIQYNFDVDWPIDFPDEQIAEEQDRIRDAFIRAGVADHLNIDTVMEELRSQDDVILGIDGNILRDGVLTSTLLEKIYEAKFPNWILICIPKLVVSDIERAAKQEFTERGHPLVGWPTYEGRVGQRALQEVMNLREENPDRPGLSVMTIGELQGGEYDRDDWRANARIRDQFREYLDNIGYRKGTYFVSQDRINVMMTDTEGGGGLHLQKPEYEELRRDEVPPTDFADLIHELCVQFGSIRIKSEASDEVLLELSIYWPGKRVSDWERRRLNVVSVQN